MAKAKTKSTTSKRGKKSSGKSVEKKKLNLTEDERKRRSEAMKKRHKEGRAGASFGKLGGRPKKKRAAEVAAEVAADHGKEMAQVFLDAMAEENPNSIRMKAAEGLYKIEEKEARLQMDEEEHLARLGRDDLLDALVDMFASNPMIAEMFRSAASAPPVALLPGDDETVIEAEVVSD